VDSALRKMTELGAVRRNGKKALESTGRKAIAFELKNTFTNVESLSWTAKTYTPKARKEESDHVELQDAMAMFFGRG